MQDKGTPAPMAPFTPCVSRRSATLLGIVLSLSTGLVGGRAESDSGKQKPVVLDTVVVDAAKTHTLFMGADISVNLDKDLYPVRDVAGTSWVVDINGKDKVVSAKKGPLNLKITPTLKLTEVAATIVGFKKEAAYSYDNDPSVLITRGLSAAASMNADLLAVQSNAEHLADIETVNGHGLNALGGGAVMASSDNQFGQQALLTGAKVVPAMMHPGAPIPNSPAIPISGASFSMPLDMATVSNGLAAAALSNTLSSSEPLGRLVTRGMDALNVEFEINSTKPLGNPYIVTMARIRTPGSKPGYVQNHIYARALDPIDSHFSHIHFEEDGFPPEYELVDFQVHIYNRGVEIATNLAANRVQLTREEAFEYVMMEYVSSHKGDTLPATPAMGKLPAELPTRIAAGMYTDTFFVKVSKDGIGREAFADRMCTKKLDDPFLAAVVKGLRFKPALASGSPVDGIASVNLTHLQF
jgi:hypothetical protein